MFYNIRPCISFPVLYSRVRSGVLWRSADDVIPPVGGRLCRNVVRGRFVRDPGACVAGRGARGRDDVDGVRGDESVRMFALPGVPGHHQ